MYNDYWLSIQHFKVKVRVKLDNGVFSPLSYIITENDKTVEPGMKLRTYIESQLRLFTNKLTMEHQ